MNNKFYNTGVCGADQLSTTDIAISSNFTMNITFSIIFAALMAISANSFIYLPFTPIPVTTQVFTVLVSGLLLGSRWALISQTLYIIIGLAGLPVFSGFKSGTTALPGPTGGYIAGFIAAAFVTGYIYESLLKNNSTHTSRLSNRFVLYAAGIASCVAGVLLIHLFGFIHLSGYFYSINTTSTISEILVRTWRLGTWPFLIIDFLKAVVAVIIITPMKLRNEKNKNK
ncbi:MAG: biotin transporter BioY [Actinomycetota bacterium]|jgi:biotin transport system substrate-specific component|nr:biotin transporter BioY [Actinomycetota bacterium]MDD5600171.1 biotin transporter BioY [Actinomycetota bacterium]